MNPISSKTLIQNFLELGVKPGSVLLVHTAFSKIRPIEGGPLGLISALRSTLGSDGTLVMPSMSYDDDHPFDKTSSPCLEPVMNYDLRRFLSLFSNKMARLVQVLLAHLATFGEFLNEIYAFCQSA